MSKYSWRMIEDNGGGLQLFIFAGRTGSPVAGMGGCEELTPTELAVTLATIEAPDFALVETRDWRGMYVDPAAAYHELLVTPTCHIIGRSLWEDGKRYLYVDRMGVAGLRAFGIIAA